MDSLFGQNLKPQSPILSKITTMFSLLVACSCTSDISLGEITDRLKPPADSTVTPKSPVAVPPTAATRTAENPITSRRVPGDTGRLASNCFRRIRRTPQTEVLYALSLEFPVAVYSPQSQSAGYGFSSLKKSGTICLFRFNERIFDLISKIPADAVFRTVGQDEIMLWSMGAGTGLFPSQSEATRWFVTVLDHLKVPRPPVSEYIRTPNTSSWEKYIEHIEGLEAREGGGAYSHEYENQVAERIDAEFFSKGPK